LKAQLARRRLSTARTMAGTARVEVSRPIARWAASSTPNLCACDEEKAE
jgi:hypothetical protein